MSTAERRLLPRSFGVLQQLQPQQTRQHAPADSFLARLGHKGAEVEDEEDEDAEDEVRAGPKGTGQARKVGGLRRRARLNCAAEDRQQRVWARP